MWTQEVQPKTEADLKVMLDLPEEYIGQKVRIYATLLGDEQTIKERLKNDPFFKYLDSLNIQRGDWKFDRDEANER